MLLSKPSNFSWPLWIFTSATPEINWAVPNLKHIWFPFQQAMAIVYRICLKLENSNSSMNIRNAYIINMNYLINMKYWTIKGHNGFSKFKKWFQNLNVDHNELDMSTARRRLKSPRSLSGTSTHPTMVTLVNIMIMNGWLTPFSFHVNRPPHSWEKSISDIDLEIPRSMSWVWSGARSYSRPSIILTHFLFVSHQSNQQFLRYSYFEIWPWNI